MTVHKQSILIVTGDAGLSAQCEESLKKRFHVDVESIDETEIKRFKHDEICPMLFIWDARERPSKWLDVISWMRDYSGKPIIAITQSDDEDMRQDLYRYGIQIQLDIDSTTFLKSLQVHIFAILLDAEKGKSEVLGNGA